MTRTALTYTAAALLLILAAQAFNMARPYDCQTDTECEAEEAARCWILCQR